MTKILVVDDNVVFRTVLAHRFEKIGFHVSHAVNGIEALELTKSTQFDVLVSDICMPQCDGVRLLDLLRNSGREMPVVMLITGYTEVPAREAFLRGADALFGKPFNGADLVECVRRLIDKPSETSRRDLSFETRVSLTYDFSNDHLSSSALVSLHSGGMYVALSEASSMDYLIPNIGDLLSFKIPEIGGGRSKMGSGKVRWISFRSSSGNPAGFWIDIDHLSELREDVA